MSDIWFCVPSKRPPEEADPVLLKWAERGYNVAVWRDPGDPLVAADLMIIGPYRGYGSAVNQLGQLVARKFGATWIVAGGDDTEPDPNHTAAEIATECEQRFFEGDNPPAPLFRVMQPTGDRYADGCIDRICGSPWIGAEFMLRMYGGRGAFFEGYRHMFVDEELQEVAIKMGCFWQRPDLIHLHRHFMRQSGAIDSPAIPARAPEFLQEANSPEHWDKYKKLFLERKAAGFPGCEPAPL